VIVVDSSVWIGHLRRTETPQIAVLRQLVAAHDDRIVVGDLILMEILQGARDNAHAARIERDLRQFRIMTMLGADLAVEAARHYRYLRSVGVTIRKTIDVAIATFCLTGDHSLLHADRDFEPMEVHLGLKSAMGMGGR
jgi:predicted nucleic acid-binding protein